MYDPFALPPTDLIPLEGYHVILRGEQPGIYQLEARLILPDSREINFPFVRMRDAKSIKNRLGDTNQLLIAGKRDYFGVYMNEQSKAIRDAAVSWLGASGYSLDKNVPTQPGNIMNPSTKNRPKCNLFVTHISNSVGATTPYFARWGNVFGVSLIPGIPSAPIAKFDWFQNPETNIDIDPAGWHFLADSISISRII